MAASEVFNANENEVSRPDIQAAIAKAVELREIHATLLQGKYSPTNLGFPSASPVSHSRHASQFSAQDYPVFTPVSFSFSPISCVIWDFCALYGLLNSKIVELNQQMIAIGNNMFLLLHTRLELGIFPFSFSLSIFFLVSYLVLKD